MAKRDYYDVLGINKSANPDEIKNQKCLSAQRCLHDRKEIEHIPVQRQCPERHQCARFNKEIDIETGYTTDNWKTWLEKIHDVPTEGLEPGDLVYFRTPGIKGKGRWKRDMIIGRKEPYVYSDGIRTENGFDIFNVV